MKKTIASTLLISLALAMVISCEKKKKDNTGIIAAALILNQRRSGATGVTTVSGTVTQQRQVSTARAGAQGAANAARTASGRTAMFFDKKVKEFGKELMAFNIQKAKGSKTQFKDYMSKKVNKPQSLMTFATCTDQNSASCDGTDTVMTFNGARSCSSGGTMTANAFRVAMSGATQDALQLTMSGGISYAACKENAIDFQNYPNTILSTLTSGAISIAGTYSFSDITSGTVFTFDEKGDYTVNSTTDMVFTAGTPAVKIENLTSKTALKTTYDVNTFEYLGASGNSLCKGITECASVSFASVFGTKATYVLDGTLAVTGKVGGSDAGMNLTLSNRTVNYRALCNKSILTLTEADVVEGSSVCSYTAN